MMEGNGVFRQTALVHTIYVNDVTKISGNGATAVRPGAQVNNVSSHPSRGDIPLPPRDANVKQGGSRNANMEREEQAYQDTYAYERARPGRKSFSSESNSGSYCLPKVTEEYYQQNFGSKWTPKPIKFIHRVQDPADETLSKESFLQDVDKSLKEFESSGGKLKKELEEVILLQVLPYLEESWGKSSSQKMDAYVILAKLSSCRSCSEVVWHALQQLQYLLFRENLDSCKESLLKVEKIVRSSIISPDAVFKEEADSAREVRLSVYKRILSLICIYQIQTGFSTVDFKDGLKKLQQDLKHYCTPIRYKKKNYFRYSMEFIQGAISYLLKGSSKATATNLGDCLDNCLSLLENQESDVTKEFPEKLKKIVKKVKTGEWFDLHCVLCYLHGKVHSERPTPEMCIERRALILLRRIVEAYQKEGGGDDWRFCLLAGSLLSDIAMNNMTKELRIEAGCCMINLLRDKRLQKKPECRVILESLSSEMLFNPDHITKTLFAGHLLENRSLQQPLPEDLHVQHLTNRYRNQTLEINKPTISQGQKYFVKRGMFQRSEVIVKICNVTKQDILESESPDHSGKREKIISEAYNLRRLRCFNHPNIAVLLGCNTKSLPYHVITEFEKKGNLLCFVQASRWDDELLPTRILLKMLLDVIEALLFLENHGLVHRAVMAENILVGDDCRCKLGGMHALRQLQKGYAEEDRNDDEMYDYCSSDDCCLDVVCHDDGEESVRWKAPECILKKSYSTASDVWAFGVLMYEVFTYGCRPYRNIRSDKDVAKHVAYNNGVPARESCFQDEEFKLMTRCWERHRSKRIALASLKERLEKVLDVAMDPESEEKPRDDPPPLETCIDYTSCQSDEKGDDAPTRYDAAKDGTLVMEKITNADKNHLRRLLNLNTPPDLARILRIDNLDSHHPVVEMISPEAPFGNLKDYVLSKQCQLGDIVTFLSQVTSALHFLHSNHIVHGDLRAEYVNVIAPNKVQVTRLGRSLLLPKRAYDNTSASCVVQRNMPPDATRWSAPEVIQDGNYTHASDVWAFAVLGWELYTAFATGQEHKEYSVPYCNHAAEEVIHQIRNVGPLSPPDNCPDWVYIVMHQCWAFDPVQRPPFIAIFDCLTTRQPMNSWLMSLWKERHEKSEWPDSSITQPENACHITNQDKNCLKEIIEQMCNDGYKLSEHDYRYVQENAINRVDEEFYDDLPVEKCSKTSSDVIGDECYEDISPTSRSDYDFEGKMAESPTDSNTSSTEPRYQNVKNFGIKKIPYRTEEEELYDDIDNIRHQNISTVNTLVVGEEEQEEAETYDDISEEGQEFYEDIEERSRDPCHGACANEPSSKDGNSPLNTESQEPSFEEDIYSVDEETDPVDPEGEDLYEEIDNLRPPSYAKACNETEQANVDSKNASCLPRGGIPRGGVPSVNEVEFLYEEIGGNQTTDSAAYQSTTGPQDHRTTNNRDEAGYRELSQRESYMQLTRPTAKKPNPAMKNAAKLNNRRLPHKRKETINDRLRNTVKEP